MWQVFLNIITVSATEANWEKNYYHNQNKTFIQQQDLDVNICPSQGCTLGRVIVDIIHQFMSKTLVKDLTCCGLQKKQGEETADQVCTLHDGCQENSDCHTGYIYQGRKVKGHVERGGGAQRGPASGGAGVCVLQYVLQESWHTTGTPRGLAAGAPLKRTGSAVLETFRTAKPGSQYWYFQVLTVYHLIKYVLNIGRVQCPSVKHCP